MTEKHYFKLILRFTILLFCIVWLVYMMLNNEVPVDVGDGITHYFISQASWNEPSLFLNHWGKPFFILVSSPFSQFGFNGLVVFNILVFASTILIGYRILEKKGVSIWLQILFPLILLKAHDIANTVLGGLTEPLFNLAVIAALYLLLEKKYIVFAIIVSLLPFMRSEGQLPVLLALILLVYNKSYKAIPFLFSGFLVYALIGIVVFGDFWWYFTESPYSMGNNIYGHGTWDHYFISYKNYIGNPGLYILILSIPSMFLLLFQRRWKELELEWWFFAYGIFMGVLLSHSYFWATGQNGSIGLTRIATQGVPVFLLLHIYYLSRFKLFQHWISSALFGVFSIGLILALITTKYYPKTADPLDKEIINAAKFLKVKDLKQNSIFYHFPLFCYAYGENSYMKNGRTIFYSFSDLEKEIKETLKPGDIIIRDSHFGPVEMLLPHEKLAKHPELVIIREFISDEQKPDQYNEKEGVTIYQYIPLNQQQKVTTRRRNVLSEEKIKIDKNQEFTSLDAFLPHVNQDIKVNLIVQSHSMGLTLVYDYNNLEAYSKTDLIPEEIVELNLIFKKAGVKKLYIWNPKKVNGEITVKKLETEELDYHPLLQDQR